MYWKKEYKAGNMLIKKPQHGRVTLKIKTGLAEDGRLPSLHSSEPLRGFPRHDGKSQN